VEAVSELSERTAVRLIWLLVIVEVASSVLLWTIDTSSPSGESFFGLYLSLDLIAFAMMTYVYRVTKVGDAIGRLPVLVGCAMLVVLVFATLIV
jgi:hypothetical protein